MENNVNDLLGALVALNEAGGADSSLFRLEDLMFCDIPQFLDNVTELLELGDTDLTGFDKEVEAILASVDGSAGGGGTGVGGDGSEGGVGSTEGGSASGGTTPTEGGDMLTGIPVLDDRSGETIGSVIIEFGADTVRYGHEPFVWAVSPGQQIDSNTIIAYCKQRNKVLPVRSIFSSGTVRQDKDGGFWRCWGSVTSRHIVIDNVRKDYSHDYSAGYDYDALYNDEGIISRMGEKLRDAGDIFTVVTQHLPYVLYSHLLYHYGDMRKRWWVDGRLVLEPITDDKKPEVVFSEFVNNVYLPRRERWRQELASVLSSDEILASGGAMSALKSIAQRVVDINRSFYNDCLGYYRHHEKWARRVIIEADERPNVARTRAFMESLGFKFEISDEHNFHIKEEAVMNDFVKNIDTGAIMDEYGGGVDCSEYLERSFMYEGIADELRVRKETAAFAGEGIRDYYGRLTKELFFDQQYWQMRFKALCHFFSKAHPTDDTEGNRKLLEVRDEVMGFDRLVEDMTRFYDKFQASNIAGKGEPDWFRGMLEGYFKEYARWPMPTSYFYRPTHETFTEHYLFNNIDEARGIYDPALGVPYNGRAIAVGDWAQLTDFRLGRNSLTGTVPDDWSVYQPPAGTDESRSYGMEGFNDVKDKGLGEISAAVDDMASGAMNITVPLEDAAGDYGRPEFHPDRTAEELEGDITQFEYWVRYFGLATVATLQFLACGIPLPMLQCIPLPCIYIPIKVIPLDSVGIIIVVGIAVRGAYVGPIMLWVNMKSAENSMLLPVTMAMEKLYDTFQTKITSLTDMATKMSTAETATVKGLLTAQLKLRKEYEAKIAALKSIETEDKQNAIDNIRRSLGEDLRQTLTRLPQTLEDTAAKTGAAAADVTAKADEAVGEIASGVTERTTDVNTVSASIK